MKKIVFFILLFFILFPNNSVGQSNDTEAALYNVGFSAVFSGIGAVINKKPGEKTGKVFLKGLYQGAIGGYVTFESKRLLREAMRNDDWKLYWASNILNFSGASIKENAANNIDFWERWYFNIGFNRIEFYTKDTFTVRYKVMPITAAYTISSFFTTDFDVKSSLKTGHLIFIDRKYNQDYYGYSLPGTITLANNIPANREIITRAHEIIHLYQSEDFSLFNSYYGDKLDKYIQKYPKVNSVSKWIYLDLHLLVLRAAYLFEHRNVTLDNYYDNYFEHEAKYYTE